MAGGLQQARVKSAKTELAQVREQHAQAVADHAVAKSSSPPRALEIGATTAREQQLQATIDKQDQDARNAQPDTLLIALLLLLLTACASDSPLSPVPQVPVLVSRQVTLPAHCPRARCSRHPTTRVLAELLQRADDREGSLADFADRAHAAGFACQRAYGSARHEP